jgi:excisionase family DNA binding protein
MLAMQPTTVLEWVRRQKIPAVRLPSGQVRFRPEQINEWLDHDCPAVVEHAPLSIVRRDNAS